MIAGPVIARMLSSFDETLNSYGESAELYSHHENTTSYENIFKKEFKNLKHGFEKVGNPFFEDTKILYTLVTKDVMNTSANKSFYKARTLEAEQYSSYKERIFVLGSKSIMKILNATSCYCIKIQTKLSYLKHRKK